MVKIFKIDRLSQYDFIVFEISIDIDISMLEFSKKLEYFESLMHKSQQIEFENYKLDIFYEDHSNRIYTIGVWKC
jgi:hypothetical protein